MYNQSVYHTMETHTLLILVKIFGEHNILLKLMN